MRIRLPVGWTVGAVAFAAAVAHMWGLQSPSRNLTMTGGAVLFVALATAALAAMAGRDGTAGWDATAGRLAPVLLTVGLLALAGAVAAGAVWYLPGQPVADYGWFAYSPGPAAVAGALRAAAEASVARQRWYGLVALLAVGCLAAAAVAKPRAAADPAGSGQRRSTVVIAVAGAFGAGWLGWDLWSVALSYPGPVAGHIVDIMAGAWPQLLTVPLAAVAAALTVRRQSAGGWLAAGASAIGLAAFAVFAALAADHIAGTLTGTWFANELGNVSGNARSGNTAGVMFAVATGNAVASDDAVAPHAVYPFGTPGLVAGYAVVAGGILLVAGSLHRPRH